MRVFNGGFIVLFMAMLMLPLVFMDLSSDRISVEENRSLAETPRLADMRNHPRSFIWQFNNWFNDSTGFRGQFIKLYQFIEKINWLGAVVRYTDGQDVYLIGEEGHRYYTGRSGELIPKFQGKQFLSDEQMANMANKLEKVKYYLDSKGIPLVVMLCADKESVYPEFYPKSIKRGPEPIQLDVITKYLQENTSVDVFNIRQALLAEKNNYLLYYRIDTRAFADDFAHYNEIGAFFAYRELMKHINIHFPRIVPYEINDIEIIYDKKGIPDISLKSEITYKKLDASFFNDVKLDQRPFTWENEVFENAVQNLPVILFIRDSYAGFSGFSDGRKMYISRYFAQHCSKTILIHWRNIRHLDEYITCYKPDIVVFESAERNLGYFAYDVAGIPELP